MHLLARRALTLALMALLSSSFVTALPVSHAQSAAAGPALPGFRLVSQAPSDLPVLVNVLIPLRNTGLLTSLVEQVSDPGSPLFGHFLTQAQLREDFEPTGEFSSMMALLATTGLKVDDTALDSVVLLEGTASQVSSAFGRTVEIYSNGTRSYYALSGGGDFDGAELYVSNMTSLMARPALAARPLDNATYASGGITATLLQKVYNATSLYAQGVDGNGQDVGVLDFLGSPTIAGDLASFDAAYGLPPSRLSIVPIGPYDPNLGAAYGWNTEISLDVEMSHAMAPGASQTLYVANEGTTLASILAIIVQDDAVTSLSQSFTFPEWEYSYYGTSVFVPYALGADEMYEMGALEGITFSAATGDAGGTGLSTGPLGDLGYPSSSPFVTAMGGTQTYAYTQAGSTVSTQTAYSDLGYVPNFSNTGGSGGGVSTLEPRPWYQANQTVPATYPDGRMAPDLSLQSGVYPGTYIVADGETLVIGGTSEASPLFAGLVALTASDLGSRLGLVNPSIYQMGNDPAVSSKVFLPVTFGYTIPWTPAKGYNLATGWGALNVGEFADAWKAQPGAGQIGISVNATGAIDSEKLEYTPGTPMHITANITQLEHGKPSLRETVASGSFEASLSTLAGTKGAASLAYNETTRLWQGTIVVGNESGIAYVQVSGTSGSSRGLGLSVVFLGYLGQFGLLPTTPYTDTYGGNIFDFGATTLDGNGSPDNTTSLAVSSYSIASNKYSSQGVLVGNETSSGVYRFDAVANYPTGDTELVALGDSYGYLPFVTGIYLQNSYIFPETIVPPGSVAPGQELTVITSPEAPYNVDYLYSENTGATVGSDVRIGSNVTATLLSPQGRPVSSAALTFSPCEAALSVCGGQYSINGQLPVPVGASAGLYTVVLTANYTSTSLDAPLGGSFFGQVWVSGGLLTPSISVTPATVYEGETANISASITYPDGQEVEQGLFAAAIYPEGLQSLYSQVEQAEFGSLEMVPLTFNPAAGRWVGAATLPSPSNAAVLNPIEAGLFDYSGPYDAAVAGLSYDGFPASSALSAEQGFFVQPYTLNLDQTVNSTLQAAGLAFQGATITADGTLNGDLFLGPNAAKGGTLTIADSELNGTLDVTDEHLTLFGVSGGDIVAQGSTVTLEDSNVASLQLTASTLKLNDSSYRSISPAPPSLSFLSPLQGQTLDAPFNVSASVQGQGIQNATALLDGAVVGPGSGPLPGTLSWKAQSPPDGVHTLTVVVVQADGLATTFTEEFSTDIVQAKLGQQLQSASSSIQTLGNQLGATNKSLNSARAALVTTTDLLYLVAIVAAAGLVAAVLAIRRKAPDRAAQGPPVAQV